MKKIVGSLIATSAVLSGVVAEEAKSNSFVDAFKNGKVKGTIGTYFEMSDLEASYKDGSGALIKSTDNFSWQTAYLKLKYETARWNRLKLGAEFIGHGQVFQDSDSGRDYYDKDLETNTGLAQVYVDFAFTDSLSLRAGRWSHGDFTHIDDAQAQGIYLRSEGEKFSWVVGAFNEFAELDYDDMEDWTKDSQDLSDADSYGEDSDDFAVFAEVVWAPIDALELNPYVYHQGEYATVAGIDGVFTAKIGDNLKAGVEAKGYHVSSEVDGRTDSTNWIFEPFVKLGGFTFSVGHAEFGGEEDDPALNKPRWFRDYLLGFDQDREYAAQNAAVNLARIKYKNGKFGAHLYYGMYEFGEDQDKEANETELQFKYKFASNWDANIRLFDVDFNGDAAAADYQKVEARVRFKF